MWRINDNFKKCSNHGAYFHLVKELILGEKQIQYYFRLTGEQFQLMLHQLEEMVVKDSNIREAVCSRQ